MGTALPFSDIDKFVAHQGEPISGCILDTNFLIAAIYDPHPFHEDAEFLFEKFEEHKIPVHATVTTRAEFIDIQRRIIITEVLMDMLSPDTAWRLTEAQKKELRKHRAWLDSQPNSSELPILPDKRIKECKEIFFLSTRSGKDGWIEICKHYLDEQLLKSWEEIVDLLGINYIELRESDTNELIKEKVSWKNMCKISERTCISSSDAMILNMLNCSTLPFLVSADYDMAYAMLAEPNEKTILVPNALYREKIRKLKI